MKKTLLTITACLFFSFIASAQLLPEFQFGIKGGADYSVFPNYGNYNNSKEVGYVGGMWARFGTTGLIFQPEAYLVSKNTNSSYIDNNALYFNKARLTSLDVPLLVGGKIGKPALGVRFYTGPVISFALGNNQSFDQPDSQGLRLYLKDQNFAWQFGGGVDVSDFSFDVRYEAGLSSVTYGDPKAHTRVNLFNLTIGYSFVSLFDGF